ncbi:hypothetical protein BH11MYX1_BH11MYX1_33710 [soil metagenome]
MIPAPTARLVFRAWRQADPFATTLFGDPRVTALVGGPFDAAQIAERLATELAKQRTHGFTYWPIETHAGEPVGCCGLKPRAPGTPELGYYLVPGCWRAGYAAEAASSVIELAFGALDADAIGAGHHPENHASGRVLAKLGFRYVGHELYPPTGLEHPGYVLRNPRRPAT